MLRLWKNVYIVILIFFSVTSAIAGALDDEPKVITMNDVNKTLEQTSSKEHEKLGEVIKRGNDFIIGYYVRGVHEAAAQWWTNRYEGSVDGPPLGTVTDETPWWYSDDVAISGNTINKILDSVAKGNYPSGCPNIHLAGITQNKNGIALRYEFLVVGVFSLNDQKFDGTHHSEIWTIELSFNHENKLDDIRFLTGNEIELYKNGLEDAQDILKWSTPKNSKWTKEGLDAIKQAIDKMQQASSICKNY